MTDALDRPGSILEETIAQIQKTLGSDFEKITIDRAVIGIFFTGVKLSEGFRGHLFYTHKRDPGSRLLPQSARAMPYPGRFAGRSVTEFIQDLPQAPPLKKAVGIAIVNALSESCR